jgi:hypothetical protein
VAQLIEKAPTARSKCRGCGEKIAAGELRFGETLPNPFGEGETTHWFHLECAAYRRPEPMLAALEGASELPERERLEADARRGIEHPRLVRVAGAERAPTGRAQCRHCREPIAKDSWRVSLVFYEDERFQPAGHVHARCAPAYFEADAGDVLARVRRFAAALSEQQLAEVRQELTPSAAH